MARFNAVGKGRQGNNATDAASVQGRYRPAPARGLHARNLLFVHCFIPGSVATGTRIQYTLNWTGDDPVKVITL
ncbi:hypothetical protein [Cupriavidus sp. SK-3]|uniref:hypothetical protein n=1 Tax=Cupriavidus sp. SK-3 TaxID=1470558 RepID=UPI001268BF7E|nr:hypothetical protein [Cupriavidus sp. SK-3]